MPRGHSLSIFARFSGKRRTSLFISRENSNTAQRSCNLFLGKHKEKLARKARVNTEWVRRIVSHFLDEIHLLVIIYVYLNLLIRFLLFGSSCTCVFKEKSLRWIYLETHEQDGSVIVAVGQKLTLAFPERKKMLKTSGLVHFILQLLQKLNKTVFCSDSLMNLLQIAAAYRWGWGEGALLVMISLLLIQFVACYQLICT